MTSTNIYTSIKPSYLYIKQHSITGLKYFGKTCNKDPYKYPGSGTHWTRHIKKHGKEHVVTLWVSELYRNTSIKEHALQLSKENNIVESKEWANLKPENGLDGGDPGILGRQKISNCLTGRTASAETRAKLSASRKGKTLSAETRAKMSASTKGRIQSKEWTENSAKSRIGLTRSIETKSKMSISAIGKPKSESHRLNVSIALNGVPHRKVTCPYCPKIGGVSAMTKHHFDNCKYKNYHWNLPSDHALL
jgi:hypothetical protein